MKNLTNIEADKLDTLPSQRARHLDDSRECRLGSYRRYNGFPDNHVRRFLQSRVGYLWVDVVREYVKLDWISLEFRTYTKLTEYVETHTFLKDGEVSFFTRTWRPDCETRLKDERAEIFYVHPKTLQLAHKSKVKRPRWHYSNDAWCKILQPYNQLIKLKGIWYNVFIKPEDLANPLCKFVRASYAPTTALLSEDSPFMSEVIWNESRTRRVYIQKVQLNSHLLQRFGLVNDPY